MATWHRSAKVTHHYASLFHGAGRLEEALNHYDKALQIHDDNAVTDYCVARINMQLGRYGVAHKRFEKIAAGNGIGFGHHNMYLINIDFGWTLAKIGRYADALPMLTEAGVGRNVSGLLRFHDYSC